LLQEQTCLAVLNETAGVLWDAPDSSWGEWLQSRTVETIASGFLGACQRICDGLEPGDILADIDRISPDEEGGSHSNSSLPSHYIWLTEATAGGTGFIEQVLQSITESRQGFLGMVDSALAPSDFELADVTLRRLLSWLSDEEPEGSVIRNSVASYRAGKGHQEMATASYQLRTELRKRGLPVTQPALASVNLRILRTGSSIDTDKVLASLVEKWVEAEEILGIEIESRVFACVMSERTEFDNALSTHWNLPSQGDRRAWRFDTFLSLLWPRGAPLRAESLRYYHPYRQPLSGDRLMLQMLNSRKSQTVDVTAEDWRKQLIEALLRDGQATLWGSVIDRLALKEAVVSLLTDPLDTGSLLLYAEVRGTASDGNSISVDLELPEYFS